MLERVMGIMTTRRKKKKKKRILMTRLAMQEERERGILLEILLDWHGWKITGRKSTQQLYTMTLMRTVAMQRERGSRVNKG